ncbi:hypothetical protein CVS40_12513 [Lucilia cuprina]|nr:hypothetical protein CVS40_12513 [Lucilia cuprina]
MKMSGRKTSAAYELYGFIPKVENGKHAAICTSCNRVLQNTAAIRLQKHRNSCLAARANGGDPVHFPNLEIKKRITPKTDTVVQQNENINANVKTEQSNMEFEDATLNDNANDNATYDDVVENLQDFIPSRKFTTKKQRSDDKLKAKIQFFKEKSKYFRSEMNNLKIEKTMMVLKVKKLRLEIKQLEMD